MLETPVFFDVRGEFPDERWKHGGTDGQTKRWIRRRSPSGAPEAFERYPSKKPT